jgi:hypothetical protein
LCYRLKGREVKDIALRGLPLTNKMQTILCSQWLVVLDCQRWLLSKATQTATIICSILNGFFLERSVTGGCLERVKSSQSFKQWIA